MPLTYVYVLRSVNHPDLHYTGVTTDVKARLIKHNHREVPSTKDHAPWSLEIAVAFRDANKASAFERYLKSGSGRAFALRHF